MTVLMQRSTPTAEPTADHPPSWLVGDIGGTNARLGWVRGPGAPVERVRVYRVAEHASLTGVIENYLNHLEQTAPPGFIPPRHAALAVATVVAGDEIVLTNSHWRLSRSALVSSLGLSSCQFLNDFEALALSLPRLTPAQLRCHGALPGGDLLAVIGPGTGLGVGSVLRTPSGWVALPGEGGHATLAPADDEESELLRHIRREFAHVSAERLLSGIGLPVLYRAVAAVQGQTPQDWGAEHIVNHGLSGNDALCSQTLDHFCAMLGGFAGNVALTLGARGGIYIGGGIVPRLGERFFSSRFRARFEAKGRFQPYLAAIPTAVITDTLAALSGAAFAIEQRLHSVG